LTARGGDALNTQDNVRRNNAEHNDLSHVHQPSLYIRGWGPDGG
jgi:hypothetical protein